MRKKNVGQHRPRRYETNTNKFRKDAKSIARNGRQPILLEICSANKIFEARDRNRKSVKGGDGPKRYIRSKGNLDAFVVGVPNDAA